MRTLTDRPEATRLALMLGLTFSTGVVDAVGYLGLDRVFTGNMTGNVVILGMALVGGTGLPLAGPAVALGAFMSGAAVAGRTVRGAGAAWTPRHTALFTGVGAVLLAASALLAVVAEPSRPVSLAVTAALGAAMGCQAGAARHVAVADVTTVVVTSTLTGLASDSVLGSAVGQPWRRRAGAVVLIVAGAAAGALLLQSHVSWGLVVSGAISLTAAVIGHRAHPA